MSKVNNEDGVLQRIVLVNNILGRVTICATIFSDQQKFTLAKHLLLKKTLQKNIFKNKLMGISRKIQRSVRRPTDRLSWISKNITIFILMKFRCCFLRMTRYKISCISYPTSLLYYTFVQIFLMPKIELGIYYSILIHGL